MEFEILIDDNYLVSEIVRNIKKYNYDDIKEIINAYSEIDKQNLIELFKYIPYYIGQSQMRKIEEYSIFPQFKEDVLNTPTFKTIKFETEKYKEKIAQHLHDKKDIIDKWQKDCLRIELPKEKRQIYLSHPDYNTGFTIGNTIFWSHENGKNNIDYDIYYFAHEYLHTIFPNTNYETKYAKIFLHHKNNNTWSQYWSNLNILEKEQFNKQYKDEDNYIHSIIELLADNELRKRLGNVSDLNIEHDFLIHHREVIKPFFDIYLSSNDGDINRFVDSIYQNKDVFDNQIKLKKETIEKSK